MGYIANFIVYTLAMVGVIVFALFVFKNATSGTTGRSSKYLKVVDSMSLGQRKMLYIVSTGNEKFLIAGDVDKTTLISKLDFNEPTDGSVKDVLHQKKNYPTFQETMADIKTDGNNELSVMNMERSKTPSYMDTSINEIKASLRRSNYNTINTSVMKNLAERIK